MDEACTPPAAAGAADQLEALLDAAVDAIIIIDGRGMIERFNAAAERMFGRSAGEMTGRNVNTLMPEPHRSAHDSYMDRYLVTGEAHIIGVGREVTALRADGATFSIRLSVGRVGGTPPRFVGILHDISRQKQTEAALTRERDRAQRYLDVAEVVLLALDRHGRITLINRKGCEILEADEEQLIGRDWFETCVPADVREALTARFHRVVAGEAEPDRREGRVLTLCGNERLIAWRNRILTDEKSDVIGILSCGEDITDWRMAEQDARLARDRLAHVGRLSTIGEMAAGLAHEINQPLTAIATYAQACQRLLRSSEAEVPSELAHALGQISSQALRAGEVIRRLRNMTHDRQSRREPEDCTQLIKSTVVLAEADARANDIELALDLASEPLIVQVDDVQIQQVLLNLIRNAIDASEKLDRDQPILIRSRRIGVEAVIAVVDHGCGLTPGTGEELFDPFYTTKSTGTGLGLPISRSIIRAHGGRIEFRGNEKRGMTFSFTLPLRAREDDEA